MSVANYQNSVDTGAVRVRRSEIIDRIDKFPSVTLDEEPWGQIAAQARAQTHDAPVLIVEPDDAERLTRGAQVLLRDRDGKRLAILHLAEIVEINAYESALIGEIEPITFGHD